MNRIKQIIRKPLSDSDLKHILGSETRIITYPQLANYRTIEELLPKSYDFCDYTFIRIASKWALVRV
jgi:hypothetical protein